MMLNDSCEQILLVDFFLKEQQIVCPYPRNCVPILKQALTIFVLLISYDFFLIDLFNQVVFCLYRAGFDLGYIYECIRSFLERELLLRLDFQSHLITHCVNNFAVNLSLVRL